MTEKLIRSIDQCGLCPGADVRSWIDALPKPKRPETDTDLATWLVQQSRLTQFQVDCLLDEKPIRLVYDEYTVLDEIGEGGMGQVFKAMHRHMHRVVALKVMRAHVMESEDSVRRFEREVRAAARLSHPNIVTAYDAGHADNIHYLVMEYLEGSDLSDLTKRETLDIATGVNFILQAAKGLQYAHQRGVIHRDIKPANLLVTPDGVIKILDMGIARTIATDAVTDSSVTQDHVTQSGVLIGSIDFMAPEQAARADSADQRSDIYSLGCTAFFSLAGREVYQGDTILQKLFAHQGKDIPSLQEERADVPPELDEIVQKMIAKNPADRYQTMDQVIAALTRMLDQLPDGTLSIPDFELPRVLRDRSKQQDEATKPYQESGTTSASTASCGEGTRESLRRFISSRGSSDTLIDYDEEQSIFHKGGDLGLSSDEVDGLLNDVCQENGWARFKSLSHRLVQQFNELQDSAGGVSKAAFDDGVRLLVQHGMRRKPAIEECLTLLLDRGWKADEDEANPWFSRKLEQFGLD